MAFGLTQLGLAAAALGLAAEAYETLEHLVTRYWQANLVPTHNVSEIFNVDVCGSLPAVIVAMLVRSRRNRVDLLPACPPAWPEGQIEGVLLRDGLFVHRLAWSPRGATVALGSTRPREVIVTGPGRLGGRAREKVVAMHPGHPVTVAFTWDAR
jgi:hypothetical protein